MNFVKCKLLEWYETDTIAVSVSYKGFHAPELCRTVFKHSFFLAKVPRIIIIFFTIFFSHLVVVDYVFTYSLKISAVKFPLP